MYKHFYSLYLSISLIGKLLCLILGLVLMTSVITSPFTNYALASDINDITDKKTPASKLPSLNWHLWKTNKELSVEYRDITQSNLIEIRAKAVIKSTLSGALLFLQNTENIPRWLHNARSSKIIKKISPTENISLTTFNALWPAKTREMIIRSHYWQNEDLSVEVTMSDESERYSQHGEKGTIKISIISAHWTITEKINGTINIEHRLVAEPNGFIPYWLANRMALKSMWQTLTNIHNQLSKSPHQSQQLPNIRTLSRN
jgi:hypothetical protein